MTNTDTTQTPAPFVGPCSGGCAGYCQCDECGEMYAEEAAFEMAAEARNEEALFGPTDRMRDEAEREAAYENWLYS